MANTALNATQTDVIQRHVEKSAMESGVRVPQWDGAISVYFKDTGRLWVHNDHPRKQAFQELYFYSQKSTVGTITCSHAIKLWDERRCLTSREMARLQGFPDSMKLPATQAVKLFGNAVSVPCAAYALSRVCDQGETLRHLDVCAGIGGFSFALHRAVSGVQCVGFSEIMSCAINCYKDNFPDSPELGSALEVQSWPQCDIYTAGFPCQPFSCANSRRRRDAHKSKDFFKTVIESIRACGARRVVLENVRNFQTVGRDKFEALVQALDDMGFHVAWGILNSQDSNLPQQRKRLYIVASKDAVPKPFDRPSVHPAATLATILVPYHSQEVATTDGHAI